MARPRVYSCVHCQTKGCVVCNGHGKLYYRPNPFGNVMVEQIDQIDDEVVEVELDIRTRFSERYCPT